MKANQLSKTAAFIAIKFYGLTRIGTYRSLFDDSTVQFYEKLVQSLPAPLRWYHRWLKWKWIRRFYIWWEEHLLSGDLMHILARKWYIQGMTDELVNDGYEQIIVLGAGLDHLSHHYSKQGLRCFEFDAPYMAELKRRFLNKEFSENSQPKIIDAHFPADKFERLLSMQADLDPRKKTIVITEGFFDYLTPHIVSSFFTTFKEYFSHNFTIISTHFALNELPKFQRLVFKASVNLVGERLQLNADISEFKQLLKNHHLDIKQVIDTQTIRDNFLKKINSSLPILEGFYIIMAKSITKG